MTKSEKPLHIDIPVKLAEVKAVFSIGALAFEGDLPASIFHLQLIRNDVADWNAKSELRRSRHGALRISQVAERKAPNSGRLRLAYRVIKLTGLLVSDDCRCYFCWLFW
jgi:hypothetical protein